MIKKFNEFANVINENTNKEKVFTIKVDGSEVSDYQSAIDEYGENWVGKYKQCNTSTQYCRVERIGDCWLVFSARRRVQFGGTGFSDAGFAGNYGGHNYWVSHLDRLLVGDAKNGKIIFVENKNCLTRTHTNKKEMLDRFERNLESSNKNWMEKTGGVELWRKRMENK